MDKKEVVKDPVCGMEVVVSEARFSSVYKGKTYYFCAQTDKEMFDAFPYGWITGDSNSKK